MRGYIYMQGWLHKGAILAYCTNSTMLHLKYTYICMTVSYTIIRYYTPQTEYVYLHNCQLYNYTILYLKYKYICMPVIQLYNVIPTISYVCVAESNGCGCKVKVSA